MVQHLLHIVQREAAKDGETSVQPDVLGKGECSDSGGGDDKRRKTRGGNDGGAGQQRSTDVQVLLLLSGGSDDRQRTHHGNGVETGTGEQRTRDKGQQGGDKGGLGGVESSPESVLGDVAIECAC